MSMFKFLVIYSYAMKIFITKLGFKYTFKYMVKIIMENPLSFRETPMRGLGIPFSDNGSIACCPNFLHTTWERRGNGMRHSRRGPIPFLPNPTNSWHVASQFSASIFFFIVAELFIFTMVIFFFFKSFYFININFLQGIDVQILTIFVALDFNLLKINV